MKMKYTEQAVETLDDAGGVIANKNIEIEQLRQRVAELEKERDKAAQYWQIAEGRCDALKQQIDALVEAAIMAVEMIEYNKHERRHVRWQLNDAIASVKEKA
jgi:chromosome segregation ATPase